MAKGPNAPPLGAVPDGKGVSFALLSREAEKVELCLYDDDGRRETARHALAERTGDVWHDWLPGLRPGQRYGYRVHGPYRPAQGLRFNPHKLLIDPYARALDGQFTWNDAVFGYTPGHPDGDRSFDPRDSAPWVPKGVVTPAPVLHERPARPRIPAAATIVYELHAKGMTRLHPAIPKRLQGTVEGLTRPEVIAHLHRLGITTVELLPIHAWIDELPFMRRGLVNYWGYNTLSFFVPDEAHLAAGGMDGFARMVDAFHAAGIEVILDVVYNHTAESDETGPTLSFRGIDNRTYYLLDPEAPDRYLNHSGCGNTLKAADPAVARMIADSLRYWAEAAGVDGFRFDLASVLARDGDGTFDEPNSLFAMIAKDPALAGLKLIAEPWDAARDGYRLGAFPTGFSEWNDRYRNVVRRFWSGEDGVTGELATRLSGSADLLGAAARRPSASVNFITAHDGFTLQDLVSFTKKNNWANGENNRDGESHNASFNCGVEGPTDESGVTALRRRQRRNLLATLLLSRGIAMLRAGDEFGHSQGGNNNAYCQDNETSWLDWSALGDAGRDLTAFTAGMIAFRKAHPVLTEDHFIEFPEWDGDGYRATWLTPEGHEMTARDWRFRGARSLAVMLAGGPGSSDRLMAVFNAFDGEVRFHLPTLARGRWEWVIDTDLESGFREPGTAADDVAPVAGRSVAVFVAKGDDGATQEVERLRRNAQARGIAAGYHDVAGAWHEVSPETLTALMVALGPAPTDDAPVRKPVGQPAASRCHLPDALQAGGRLWGLALQLYGLRSGRNWGMGDFGDLKALIAKAAPLGIAAIQINPVHALFPFWPDHVSPYSPSSRRFLNPLYIAVEDVPGFSVSASARQMLSNPAFRHTLDRLRGSELVEHTGVARCKMPVLRLLYEDFRDFHMADPASPLARAFRDFRDAGGEPLADFATFEALAADFATRGQGNWRGWGPDYRGPRSAAVRRFAAEREDEVTFSAWLQWVAATQLHDAGRLARERGMAIGIVADIAIGSDVAGAEAWCDQDLVALDAEIGAPPDPFNETGQAWGAPPWRPDVLRARGYQPISALLDASMGWAGGIRLDHVIGLERQFWVPRGRTGKNGAYVAYPRDDLMAVVAEQSRRHESLVIGEDLGTVPEGFRDRLHAAGILSTRVFYFERAGDGSFRAPDDYPYLSCATANTHDLPTLAGFAAARDIDARAGMDYYADSAEEAAALVERRAALAAIEAALAREGLTDGTGDPLSPEALRTAVHRFLAATGSALVLVQLEDVLGAVDQANLPGTTTEYPNWRRKYPAALERIAETDMLEQLAQLFRERT